MLCKRVLHDDDRDNNVDDGDDESTCVKHKYDMHSLHGSFMFVCIVALYFHLKLIRKWAHCKTTRWRRSDRPIYSVKNFPSIEFFDNRRRVRLCAYHHIGQHTKRFVGRN